MASTQEVHHQRYKSHLMRSPTRVISVRDQRVGAPFQGALTIFFFGAFALDLMDRLLRSFPFVKYQDWGFYRAFDRQLATLGLDTGYPLVKNTEDMYMRNTDIIFPANACIGENLRHEKGTLNRPRSIKSHRAGNSATQSVPGPRSKSL